MGKDDITDKDIITGLFSVKKHQDNMQMLQQQLEQMKKEAADDADNKGRQIRLFEGQIQVMQAQANIMKEHSSILTKQTEILNKTFWAYVVLAILALATLIVTIFKP